MISGQPCQNTEADIFIDFHRGRHLVFGRKRQPGETTIREVWVVVAAGKGVMTGVSFILGGQLKSPHYMRLALSLDRPKVDLFV